MSAETPDPRDRRAATSPPPEPSAEPHIEPDAVDPLSAHKERYARARAAMLATVQLIHPHIENEPVQLRAATSVAFAQLGALCEILLAKGLVSEEELHRALANSMETEAQHWQQRVHQLLQQLGTPHMPELP